jgi:hypothetical protein
MKTLSKFLGCLAGVGLAVTLYRVTAPPELHCSLLPELAERKLVPAKIEALTWPGDSVELENDPRFWLEERRDRFYP